MQYLLEFPFTHNCLSGGTHLGERAKLIKYWYTLWLDTALQGSFSPPPSPTTLDNGDNILAAPLPPARRSFDIASHSLLQCLVSHLHQGNKMLIRDKIPATIWIILISIPTSKDQLTCSQCPWTCAHVLLKQMFDDVHVVYSSRFYHCRLADFSKIGQFNPSLLSLQRESGTS